MWEFEIMNEAEETTIIFGYSFGEACKRYNLNPKDWVLLSQEYID